MGPFCSKRDGGTDSGRNPNFWSASETRWAFEPHVEIRGVTVITVEVDGEPPDDEVPYAG